MSRILNLCALMAVVAICVSVESSGVTARRLQSEVIHPIIYAARVDSDISLSDVPFAETIVSIGITAAARQIAEAAPNQTQATDITCDIRPFLVDFIQYLNGVLTLDPTNGQDIRVQIAQARSTTAAHPVPDCGLSLREYAVEVFDSIDAMVQEASAGDTAGVDEKLVDVGAALSNLVSEVERIDPDTGSVLREALGSLIELAPTAQPTPTQRATIQSNQPTRRPSFQSASPTRAPSQSSNSGCPGLSRTCTQLTCSQAYACLRAGNRSLDRDHDGVPCESVCTGG